MEKSQSWKFYEKENHNRSSNIIRTDFAVAGLDEFLHFLPPPPFSPDGEALIEVLRETGYFMLLVKGVEAIAGILLLAIFIVAAEIFLSIAYKEHFKSVLT